VVQNLKKKYKKIEKKNCRRCVVFREFFPKEQLIRVVKTKEKKIFIDPSFKIQGRGAYLLPSLEVVKLAFKKKSLDYALKLKVPEEIYKKLEEMVKNKEL